jgi:uncharacterized protein YjbJ (UPF0337 family)
MKNSSKGKSMTEDGMDRSVRGKANIVAGRVKDAVGGLTGNGKMQVKGKMQAARVMVARALDEEVGSDSDY